MAYPVLNFTDIRGRMWCRDARIQDLSPIGDICPQCELFAPKIPHFMVAPKVPPFENLDQKLRNLRTYIKIFAPAALGTTGMYTFPNKRVKKSSQRKQPVDSEICLFLFFSYLLCCFSIPFHCYSHF